MLLSLVIDPHVSKNHFRVLQVSKNHFGVPQVSMNHFRVPQVSMNRFRVVPVPQYVFELHCLITYWNYDYMAFYLSECLLNKCVV